MIDFFPVEYYTIIFNNAIFLIVLFSFFILNTKGYEINNPKKKEYRSLLLLIAVTLYIGLRPIDAVFVDMTTYASIFKAYASGELSILLDYDVLWQLFMKTSSNIMTVQLFFLLCAILYVFPLYRATQNLLANDRFILFLMFIASFSFWAYGVNGIRNGIATSLFVLALSSKKKYFKYSLFAISYFVHASIIVPLTAYVITLFYTNTKYYLLIWMLSIPLSLVFGSVAEIFFASLGFGGDRLSYLTDGNVNNISFAYTGFRWDFLLYSASAIFIGYYFIIKRKFKDIIYIQLFNIYLIANAFWILVIRAHFSNRFAYLSWFLIALVVFYPFFKARFFKKQQIVLAFTILVYFGFTYSMFLLK